MSSGLRRIIVIVAIAGQMLPSNLIAAKAAAATTPTNAIFVPSIIGSSTKDAKVAIESVGLTPKFVLGTVSPSPSAALTVYSQQPEPGAVAAPGGAVAITVYSGIGSAGEASTYGPSQIELSEVRAVPFLDKSEQTIDPRTGQLFLTATDLNVPAGAISLEVTRHLQMLPAGAGMLGTRWRLNWEDRLFQSDRHAVIESEGRQLVFIWDDATGRLTSGGSDYIQLEAGRSIWVKTKDRIRETFDKQGRLVERDAGNGNKVTLSYDANGRLARIAGPKGTSLELRCDENGRLAEIESSTGCTVHYSYSSGQDAPVAAQEARSPAVRYGYTADGLLERIEHPRYGATQFAYDAKGRVTRRTWADGSSEQFARDDAARTLRHTNPSGQVKTTVWSEDDRVARISTPLGHTTVVETDADGRSVAMTGPTGQTARLVNDELGRMVAIENPATGTTRMEYLGDTELMTAAIGPGGERISLPVHLVNHLATMADLHRAGRYDRMSDDVRALTGQVPLSVQEFVRKNAASFSASVKDV